MSENHVIIVLWMLIWKVKNRKFDIDKYVYIVYSVYIQLSQR